ncbi:uncharacterized protein [Bos taurus]|uniref:uncharacterized protein isoform X2 n=1 Tax=Bos taurus TaxID=9913 RepID=UPI0028CB1CB1|nr:uncharacterized protein LOC112441838 isoform X2 [Bos taurus]
MEAFCQFLNRGKNFICCLEESLKTSPVSQVTVFLFAITILTLQFYVLLRPRSSRYCSQPLLTNLVSNIIFTFFTVGFTVLLIRMEPVPQALKRMFSVFGVGSFIEGVCTIVLTFLATDCAKTTPELYYLSVLLSVSSLVSTVLFSSLGLTWLASVIRPRPDTKSTV